MADLVGGGGIPASPGGNGLPAPRRPSANAPAPTSSPSGIKGPRMIMQERAEREARQRAAAAKQEMERVRAEQEARLQEEAQQKAAERRAAGVAQGQASNSGSQHYIDPQRRPQVADPNQPQMGAPTTPQQPTHQRTNSARYAANQQVPSQTYSSQQPQQPPPQPQFQTQPQQAHQQPGQTQADAPPQTAGTTSSKPRNSFPHAFERWETLSAHWEGLTSYWIRKLEQNKDELNRDPVSQQLARQVTDLSAAGANLFHAVVELQRLRASSERKFQRWFFETRAELERAQEVNSMLENALDQERRNRDEAIREAVEKDQGSSMAQKQLSEMRKELAISKDEARRAWEELGRREQLERERTHSLQTGNPTIVGGVQVVPMTAGAPGRQPSMRDQGTYLGGPVSGGEQSHTPTGHASPGPGAPNEDYYRQQQPPQSQHPGHARRGPESGYSEGEFVTNVHGQPVLDMHGNRIPVADPATSCSASDAEVEEYDTPATTNPPSGSYDPPTTSAPGNSQWTGSYSEPQDYTGQGYGTPGWETVPRHHHPTRLSDVIEEEDERSRTSAPSQLSRG